VLEFAITKKDASALAAILSAVGGDPKGPRGAANRFHRQLKKHGIDWESEELKYAVRGSITIEKGAV
jgi:hypothetical protein